MIYISGPATELRVAQRRRHRRPGGRDDRQGRGNPDHALQPKGRTGGLNPI